MGDFKFINHKKELEQALNENIERALTICASKARDYAQTNSEPVKSSILKQSIAFEVDAEKSEAYIGTNVRYAPYIEFGTGIYVPGGRRSPWFYVDEEGKGHITRGIKGRHFLKKALTEHIKEYENIVKTELKK